MREPPPSDAYKLAFTPPRVVVWMIVSFVAILGVMLFLPQDQLERFIRSYAFIPADFTRADFSQSREPAELFRLFLPLLSYNFLHGGLLHLVMNAIGFMLVGTIAGRRMGAIAFIAFCLLTGVLAGLTHWAFHAQSSVPMVGASGMLSGLVGATTRFAMLDLRGIWGRAGGLLPLNDRRLIVFTIIWLVLNYALGVAGVGTVSADQTIAWEAHMGGYFAGLLLFPLFDWRKPSRTPGMLVYEEIP